MDRRRFAEHDPPGTPTPSMTAAVMPRLSSSPALSAIAAPFVPSYIRARQPAQPNQIQQQYLPQALMLYQSPYQTYYGLPQPQHIPKRANASWIKSKNRAMSQEKDRLYQDWMLAQHQCTFPPISVARKPSIVLPEGDYIGYYFKPKATMTKVEPTQQMPTKQFPTIELPVTTHELVISPSDATEYRFPHKGPKDLLPLLPLNGPIFRQAKLEGDYCPPNNFTVTKSSGQSSRFLPLLEPALESAPKSGSVSNTAAPTKAELLDGTYDGDMADSESLDGYDPDANSTGGEHANAEYYGYAFVRSQPVGYLHPRDLTT